MGYWVPGYAFVRHSFEGVSALDVSMRRGAWFVHSLGLEVRHQERRVVVLLIHADCDDDDRNEWIRFSIANVDEEGVKG